MNTVGIELIDGPADGEQIIILADPMNPPATYEGKVVDWSTGSVRTVQYHRAPNPRDDGPLWLYRWTG